MPWQATVPAARRHQQRRARGLAQSSSVLGQPDQRRTQARADGQGGREGQARAINGGFGTVLALLTSASQEPASGSARDPLVRPKRVPRAPEKQQLTMVSDELVARHSILAPRLHRLQCGLWGTAAHDVLCSTRARCPRC